MMRQFVYLVMAGGLILLAACTAPQPKPEEPAIGQGSLQNEQQQILPDSRTSKTVLALLDSAQEAAKAGQNSQAESHLERALRIEPRNPVLWYYMAKLRLYQNRLKEAAGLAAKSNSLAGDNRPLRADNWRIIAQTRYQQGDVAGAKQAEAKAAEFKD